MSVSAYKIQPKHVYHITKQIAIPKELSNMLPNSQFNSLSQYA